MFAAAEALSRIFGDPIVDRLGRVRTIRATTALGVADIGVLAQSAGLLPALWLIVALFLAAFAAASSLRPRPAAA